MPVSLVGIRRPTREAPAISSAPMPEAPTASSALTRVSLVGFRDPAPEALAISSVPMLEDPAASSVLTRVSLLGFKGPTSEAQRISSAPVLEDPAASTPKCRSAWWDSEAQYGRRGSSPRPNVGGQGGPSSSALHDFLGTSTPNSGPANRLPERIQRPGAGQPGGIQRPAHVRSIHQPVAGPGSWPRINAGDRTNIGTGARTNVGVGGNTTNVNVGNVNVGNRVNYSDNRQAWVSQPRTGATTSEQASAADTTTFSREAIMVAGLSVEATIITAAGLAVVRITPGVP